VRNFLLRLYTNDMNADMSKSIVVTTRIDAATADSLDGLADRLDRSRAWIVAKAVARYVEEQTEFLDFIQEGEDAIDRGEFLTQEQMEEWVQGLKRPDAA
jgi:predicted transcriptional regulator